MKPTALDRELHDFVKNILEYAESPHNWPLTPHEQCAFIKKVMYHAQKLSRSPEYMALSVTLAVEDLAKAL